MKRLLPLSLLVFACTFAKAQVDHWETVVYENDNWRYLLPSSAPASNWDTLGYNDATWNLGPGGFGYADGDDNTVISSTISVYQRKTFTIADTSNIERLILNADYDDGYVAYINGVEISRSTITSTGAPAFNQLADANHEAVMYTGGYPDQIIIEKNVWKNFLHNGTNVLAVQTHNVSAGSSDLSARYWLHVGITNGTTTYGTTPSWFVAPTDFSSSNLPIVVITTTGPIVDEPKVESTMGIIYNGPGVRNYLSDPFNDYNGKAGIEIRGSSSSSFPKKSFGLETWNNALMDTSVTLLGMPAESDWILSASYTDKSLMNNMLSYHLFNQMGLYAPRTKYVELVINGTYQGVYVFMEKIKKDPNRVNISTLNSFDTTGLELTGGYILKIDKGTGSGGGGFTSAVAPPNASGAQTIYFQYEYPSDLLIQPQQANYIKGFVDNFEYALNNLPLTDLVSGWRLYADENSFINYFILNELSKNVDGYRLSTYLYKTKATADNKIHIGPPWDYDIAWGNANYCDGSVTSGWGYNFNYVCNGDYWLIPFWWEKLMTDNNFVNNLYCTYQNYRTNILDTAQLFAFIDSTAAALDEGQERNFALYPILGTYVWPNPSPIPTSYAGEVNELKTWITNRLAWLDANLPGVCTLNEEDISQKISLQAYPNPFENSITLNINSAIEAKTILTLKGIDGKIIAMEQMQLHTGLNTFEFNFNSTGKLSSGVYILELSGQELRKTIKLIKH